MLLFSLPCSFTRMKETCILCKTILFKAHSNGRLRLWICLKLPHDIPLGLVVSRSSHVFTSWVSCGSRQNHGSKKMYMGRANAILFWLPHWKGVQFVHSLGEEVFSHEIYELLQIVTCKWHDTHLLPRVTIYILKSSVIITRTNSITDWVFLKVQQAVFHLYSEPEQVQ